MKSKDFKKMFIQSMREDRLFALEVSEMVSQNLLHETHNSKSSSSSNNFLGSRGSSSSKKTESMVEYIHRIMNPIREICFYPWPFSKIFT